MRVFKFIQEHLDVDRILSISDIQDDRFQYYFHIRWALVNEPQKIVHNKKYSVKRANNFHYKEELGVIDSATWQEEKEIIDKADRKQAEVFFKAHEDLIEFWKGEMILD